MEYFGPQLSHNFITVVNDTLGQELDTLGDNFNGERQVKVCVTILERVALLGLTTREHFF